MLRRLPTDKYYTPQQVLQKLGITESALRNLVRTEQLHRVVPPGKKHSLFLKEEVDSYLARWLAFLADEEPTGTEFSVATREDQEEEYLLARHIFGPATHDMETRLRWYDQNSEIDYVVRHNGQIVAYLNLMPIKHDTIMRWMNGEMRGWDIPAEDVLPFAPGTSVECVAMAMATTPDASERERKHYSAMLLKGFARALRSLGERGVNITKIYATSATPSGIGIMMHAGFRETGLRLGKRIAFVLDIQESDLPLLRDYKEALGQWQQEHSQGHGASSHEDR